MNKRLKVFLASAMLGFCGLLAGATFTTFTPATGVLKGNANTPVTTAAASTDIRGLWSGTCDSTSFLRGDGACSVPAGTGVTSVSLTVPTGLSVTGSPVTGSGTLGITTALNGVLKGTGSAFTTSTSTDIKGLWSGTCDATTFLRGDGSCVAAGGASFANPSATIGLTANNGVATSALRSDASPALSQSIVPTWTGAHTFSANMTLNANLGINSAPSGTAGNHIQTRASSGGVTQVYSQSFGSTSTVGWCASATANLCQASIVANDSSLFATNALHLGNGTRDWMVGSLSSLTFGNSTDNPTYSFSGSGAFTVNSVPMTPEVGTFTVTTSLGCTAAYNPSARYIKYGNMVMVYITPGAGCTSNSSSFNASTVLPTSIRPLGNTFASMGYVIDSGLSSAGCVMIASNGTLSFGVFKNSNGSCTGGFTTSGTKDIGGSFMYPIN